MTARIIERVEQTIGENRLGKIDAKKYLKGIFLFVTKSGTSMQINAFNLALKRAGEWVGLDCKDLPSHIFRHSPISLLAEITPLKAIMDRVGHEDAEITNRIYTHVTSSMKSNIIEQLEVIGL